MSEAEVGTKAPPYAPFATFKTFLGHLKSLPHMPLRIDPSVMEKIQGSSQRQILAALRTLELINGADAPSPELHELVGAFDTKAWPTTLKHRVLWKYDPLWAAIDIKRATPQQMDEKIAEVFGITGSTRVRCTRFMFEAMKDAGESIPEILTKRRRGAPSLGPKKPRKPKDGDAAEHPGEALPPPAGTFDTTIPIPGSEIPGLLRLPKNLTAEQWGVVELWIDAAKASSIGKAPTSAKAAKTSKGGNDG